MSKDNIDSTNSSDYRQDNISFLNKNRFKLGVFGTNCSNGCTITHAETTFEPTYEHNVKIAQLADNLGFEMLVPVGRWRHFGGTTKFNGTNMEVYTWATAMACNTKEIMCFATSHVPTVHPILAAKQAATIDQISKGRFGLNVVCGWFKPEMEMFGVEQLPHDDRYKMANEWMEVVNRLWTENDFDHRGDFYKVDQNINAAVLHILEKGIIFITSDEFECILPMSKVKDKSHFNLGESYDLTISEINDSNRRIVLSYEGSDDDSQKVDNDDVESDNVDNVDDSSEDNSKE